MIYVHWIILAIYIVIVLGTIITILLDNRQPSKTMAWLLVLIFVPIVGIILYFFFGQNTRKERSMSQRSMDELTKRSMLEFVVQKDLKLPTHYQPLIQLFTNQNTALPFKDNEVDIFVEGANFFLALLKAIGQAKDHIHIESYIIEDDALTNLIADALIDKAAEGVEVRMIYDYVGCWKVPSRYFERLRAGGVDVRSFMPVHFPAFTGKVNYRNHRKLAVIDGKIGFIGGMNIAMRYMRGSKYRPWRDTHLRIRGGAVYGIQRAFLVDWYFVNRTLISSQKYYPPLDTSISNNCIAQVVTSSPISPWPEIMQGYVRILLQAQHYVYMETPYFLPTEPVLFALRTAAVAGVDVRLMLPKHSDVKIVEWASRSYISTMIEAGVKVYLYTEGFNHSKLLVADDNLCTCGSTNIDFRSFENNLEANIFFYDQSLALRMKEVFFKDQEACVLIEKLSDLTHRPFINRLWESIVRLLSPLL
ncbi:cardiolipin synthase [Hoylesella timonensis]|uniref:cardiolipin synthase n=1 Tax=Hoylesella timonensis TaxID=386414 RepID=UPI00336A7D12